MSIQAREDLVSNLVFQRESQRNDLLDPHLTQTFLIALLTELVSNGWHIEITAVRTDHSDDSYLGWHCHAHGFCVDCWPLASATPGDYLDAGDPRFQAFLRDVNLAPYRYQIGLAGSADTEANRAAAGSSAFSDDGADHIHIGAQETP